MKKKILIIFSLCVLLLSMATVAIQAWGVPDDVAEILECAAYCEKYYNELIPVAFQACMDGCLLGPV